MFCFVVFPVLNTPPGPRRSLGSQSGDESLQLLRSGRQRAAGRRVTGGARAQCGRVGVCGVRAAGRERGAGRSRERSGGGGGRRGGGGCVPAGPSCARGEERRPPGSARDRDPPRGTGRTDRELRGRVSGGRSRREEREGGPAPGGGTGGRGGRFVSLPSAVPASSGGGGWSPGSAGTGLGRGSAGRGGPPAQA